jgi:replication-associated recombination protein RarA
MSALDPREELAQRLGLASVPPVRFESPAEVQKLLAENDYLSDDAIASVTYLADRLAKPVLVEGPAGTGKTALAKAVADSIGARLIRLSATRASMSQRRSMSGTTASSCCASRLAVLKARGAKSGIT